MGMTYQTDKWHVRLLADLCAGYGLRKVVVSPGSRNGPIMLAFHNHPEIECYVVPDERSAAYVAIGIAQYLLQPVGIICTSGTASLNFAPAMAEAYYQKLPIIAITADRPVEWVDQLDGQTINQTGIYSNFTCYQAELPVEIAAKNDRWLLERIVRDGFLSLKLNNQPIHFNVPIREPLYNMSEEITLSIKPSEIEITEPEEYKTGPGFLLELDKYNKILLVLGMKRPDKAFSEVIDQLADNKKVVVLCETLSNVQNNNVFQTSDTLFFSLQAEERPELMPELVISFGDVLLSKQLKQWIRSQETIEHWIVHQNQKTPDVFQRIGKIIHQNPISFINVLVKHLVSKNTKYFEAWKKAALQIGSLHLDYQKDVPWSDMQVFDVLSKRVPEFSIVHFGNSSPVRYAQFFEWNKGIQFFGNRGTAGIDGCTSTALGMASQTNQLVTLITGDAGFLYDSNALWNNLKKNNLKIIVINNKGGNIFSLISGPDRTGLLNEYFLAHVPVSIEKICSAFAISYYHASGKSELTPALDIFYKDANCSLLEIHTDTSINTNVWKEYFKTLKNKFHYGQT
jgi:2-succinyl-5-enolpyruvyl-6-hydroxy-3-cyclohexene-1-carboxylate synthase